MKLCKDCKHYKVILREDLCQSNKGVISVDRVTGKELVKHYRCRAERNTSALLSAIFLLNTCGKSGRYWEPKE